MRRLVNVTPPPEKRFRDDPVTAVRRHWLCSEDNCGGEMIATGHGMTTMDTAWQHRCDKCGREEWAPKTYPAIVYVNISIDEEPTMTTVPVRRGNWQS